MGDGEVVRSGAAASRRQQAAVLLVLTTLLTLTATVFDRAVATAAVGCSGRGHSVIVYRGPQRAVLCDGSRQVTSFPVTTNFTQPKAGTYRVYSKGTATNRIKGRRILMDWFVGFAYGKVEGWSIGFHAIPRYENGQLIQPPGTVGSRAYKGSTGGCIRQTQAQAKQTFQWLSYGDRVIIVG
jgi:hypothetical protein